MAIAHLILCCCESPPLLGEVANSMLLMLEYQPQPLTQLHHALRRLTNKSHISFNSKLKRGLAESHQTIHPAAHPRYWLALCVDPLVEQVFKNCQGIRNISYDVVGRGWMRWDSRTEAFLHELLS